VIFDGQTIGVFDATRNMYASSPMSGDIDASIRHFVKDLSMRLPLAMLFVTTLPEELEERVQQTAIVDTSMLDGNPFVHPAVRTDGVDFQV
jgi:hypothetical protein